MTDRDDAGVLENLAKAIFEGGEGDVWSRRMQVAVFFGYYDAKTMRYFRETYGLALADQLPLLRKKFPEAKIPYEGLRHELACMGKKKSSIESELNELREFDYVAQEEK